MSSAGVPMLRMNNGLVIPQFGLGTWQSKPNQVTEAVKDAIDAGYRHVDGAYVYENECEVGAAIKSKISEGIVKREDLFIVSKAWNSFHSETSVLSACKESLKMLELEYLDLYLIHFPMGYKEGGGMFEKDADGNQIFSDVDYLETWRGMEECVNQGLVKSIGVSNFNSQQLQRVLQHASIKPVTNQVECHPHLQQKKMIDLCKSFDILVTAYSPLGAPDRPWATTDSPRLLDEPRLKVLADKYKKSPAQVLLRWQIQRGVVVIPKSVTKQRIVDNVNIFDFQLLKEDMAIIDGMDCNGRLVQMKSFSHHPHYPFGIEF